MLLPAPLLTVSTDLPSYLWSCDLWVFHTKNNRFLASVFNNRVEWLQICIVEARFFTGSPFLYRLKIKGTVPNYTRKLQKIFSNESIFFLWSFRGDDEDCQSCNLRLVYVHVVHSPNRANERRTKIYPVVFIARLLRRRFQFACVSTVVEIPSPVGIPGSHWGVPSSDWTRGVYYRLHNCHRSAF